jgi:hypothetical protein
MDMVKAFKFFLFTCLVGIIAGCKIAVIVVEGGEVQSTGSGTCLAGTVCIVEVTDTTFSDTFTAVADEGWYFEKWNTGSGFLCQNIESLSCPVSTNEVEGNSHLEELLVSDETFYIMPVFRMSGPPITDTITVDGREWAQVDLFANLTWNDINAVCAADTGVCSGELNGFDMNGWTWASVDDVEQTFIMIVIGRNGHGLSSQTAGGFVNLMNWRDGCQAGYETLIQKIVKKGYSPTFGNFMVIPPM